MNKDNAKDYLPLVQALADGKVIQVYVLHSKRWEDIEGNINFDGQASDYRIKHEQSPPYEVFVRVKDGYPIAVWGNPESPVQIDGTEIVRYVRASE